MKKKQIIGLLIAGLLFAVIGVISVFVNTAAESIIGDAAEEILAGGGNFDPPDDDYIAVVKVQGTIQEQASDTTDILTDRTVVISMIRQWSMWMNLWMTKIIKEFCFM